jgi:mannose-6-phosphate isomerase
MSINYPIKFFPILKERIWGGNQLHKLFGKEAQNYPVGESWEISTVPGSISVVANGSLKGKKLQELISTYKEKLLGEDIYNKYGENFPLLVKFIDAKTDLSVQLHPNDELANLRHDCFGKEEMWYIMKVENEACLYLGFDKELSKTDYKNLIKSNQIASVLHKEKIKKGSIYHIPTGRIHAIGGGIVLAEIQQSSDITYRLYDWDRKNANGKTRQLHTDLAIDAIDFNQPDYYETYYTAKENVFSTVLETSNFKTKILNLTTIKQIATTSKDSFIIYMCVKGRGCICSENNHTEIKTGECILIPASFTKYTINPDPKMTLLYIKAV